MLQRFRQLITALQAKIYPADIEVVSRYLNCREQELFYSMDTVDQRHCLDVAASCISNLRQHPKVLNYELLLKAALLHDVGKQAGDLSIPDRVSIVLLKTFAPQYYEKAARNPAKPYYISVNHAAIGAERCRYAGCSEELVHLVAHHHTGGSGAELELLIIADNQN